MTLREHIDQLADELGITVYWGAAEMYREGIDSLTGEMYMTEWERDPADNYWIALHEIGHWVDLGQGDTEVWEARRGHPGDPSFTLAEARAWAWAIENALPEAFPLGQVGESKIAWSITDYMEGHGWEPSPEFELIYRTVGQEPDWFYDVTTLEHIAKLLGWAVPKWNELRAVYGRVAA